MKRAFVVGLVLVVAMGAGAYEKGSRSAYSTILRAREADARAAADGPKKPTEIVATSFILVDERSKKRGALTMLGNTATLALYDAGERVRCTVQTDATGESRWTKYDAQGKPVR